MAFQINWVPTPGQNNGFVTNNTGKIQVILDSAQNSFVSNPYNSPLYICIPPTTFQGGDLSSPTLYDAAKFLAANGILGTVQNPSINYNGKKIVGGKFTLNGNPCGRYEYNILAGGTTLVQASVATLFSSTPDICSFIVCKGNLTLASSTVLIPNVNPSYTPPSTGTYAYPNDPDAKRRLFMVVYVTGNLTFTDTSSSISMSACGGNTDTTGANIGSFNIPIANNIYNSSTPNITPVIQSVGGAGGNSVSSLGGNGNTGTNGASTTSSLTTGGGGSGSANQAASGAGGTGSAFSGGAGGGSSTKSNPGFDGSSLGGAGGNGSVGSGAGGTGNLGGSGGTAGLTGTGGILIIICEGNITPNGASVQANGVNSAATGSYGGGASGGGITVVIQSSSTGSFPSTKSAGGGITGSAGGAGGNGSAYNYGINS